MKPDERELLRRLGVQPQRPDTYYLALIALARRSEELEARLAAVEQRSLGARIRRAVGRAA